MFNAIHQHWVWEYLFFLIWNPSHNSKCGFGENLLRKIGSDSGLFEYFSPFSNDKAQRKWSYTIFCCFSRRLFCLTNIILPNQRFFSPLPAVFIFFFAPLFYYLPLSFRHKVLFDFVSWPGFHATDANKTKSINICIYSTISRIRFGYLIRIYGFNEMNSYAICKPNTFCIQIHHSNAKDKHTSSQLNGDGDTKLSTLG